MESIALIRLFMGTVLGLCMGSFLSVCIHRFPRDQSILQPGSSCPSCGHRLSWSEKIPVVSYVLLGGRCSDCGASIGWTYPLLELVCGTIGFGAAWAWLRNQPDWFHFFLTSTFLWISLGMAWIDYEFSIIPNEMTYGMIGSGLVLGFVPHYPLTSASMAWFDPVQFLYALGGILLGGGVFLMLALLSPLLYGQRALGMGDVKLMGAYGAWLGPQLVFLTILLGSVLGAMIGSVLVLSQGRTLREEIPFGPFLCLAGAIALVWGPQIIHWYWNYVSISGPS